MRSDDLYNQGILFCLPKFRFSTISAKASKTTILGGLMKKTVSLFGEAKSKNEKITMVTAYDYTSARLVDLSGVDVILVGDSLGNVMLGYQNVLPVTISDMIHHGKAVVKGAHEAFVVIDMPFMSYQISPEQALENAGKIIKETNGNAIKLEGGKNVCPQVKAIVNAGIPVIGHLGLTPQSFNALGGYKVQGKQVQAATNLVNDALALQAAGVCAIVLECVPSKLAGLITQVVDVATIGIGAGSDCDGQVLVFQDLLGLNLNHTPKFVKKYANLAQDVQDALGNYCQDVRNQEFPSAPYEYAIKDEIIEELRMIIEKKELDNDSN